MSNKWRFIRSPGIIDEWFYQFENSKEKRGSGYLLPISIIQSNSLHEANMDIWNRVQRCHGVNEKLYCIERLQGDDI